jgi:hypothetical protein
MVEIIFVISKGEFLRLPGYVFETSGVEIGYELKRFCDRHCCNINLKVPAVLFVIADIDFWNPKGQRDRFRNRRDFAMFEVSPVPIGDQSGEKFAITGIRDVAMEDVRDRSVSRPNPY